MAELNWSDAQWQMVKDSVTEAFGKASVASTFLPLYGPLAGSTETVRNERLVKDQSKPPTITLDGDHGTANLKLVNVTVNVLLSSEQVADETLSNALLAFRRAANILAQEGDRIVFAGYRPEDRDASFVVNKVEPQPGLVDLAIRLKSARSGLGTNSTTGQAIVSAVVEAVHTLEDEAHSAPFACLLGNELFDEAHSPTHNFVLPADRITPLLKGGPLLRSGKMEKNTGIVVSLAANAVDIVVGTPPTVQFLQRKEDAKFLFRVYERFALRIRDEVPPVVVFTIARQTNTRPRRSSREQPPQPDPGAPVAGSNDEESKKNDGS